MQKKIEENSNVILHIDIKLSDGSIADSTRVNRQPTMIRMGQGDVTNKFEENLLHLAIGDKKTFTLTPEFAFGHVNPANIHKLPYTQFSDDITIEEGVIVEFEQMSGEKIPAIIREFDDESVTVDFNHPLCGQTLEFSVEIVDIQ